MNDQMKWVKSSYSDSDGGNCVEVARSTAVHIRDSKNRPGPEVHVAASAWSAFIVAVQPGA